MYIILFYFNYIYVNDKTKTTTGLIQTLVPPRAKIERFLEKCKFKHVRQPLNYQIISQKNSRKEIFFPVFRVP